MTLKHLRIFITAICLQLAPLVRQGMQVLAPPQSPAGYIFKWIFNASAVAGTFHALSAATTLGAPNTASGTVGAALNYQPAIYSDQHGPARSYSVSGVSPTKDISSLALTIDQYSGLITALPTRAGTFHLKIRGWQRFDLSGDSTSFDLTFTIAAAPAAPPLSFTADPVSLTANQGDDVTFSAAASATSGVTFQWIKDGTNLVGRVASSLVLAGVTAADQGQYQVRISSSTTNLTSHAATLTVVVPIIAPTITGSPQVISVHPGEPIDLTAFVNGSSPMSIQWIRNGVPIPGATGLQLNVAGNDPAIAGEYSLRASNAGGSIESVVAKVTQVALRMGIQGQPGGPITLELSTIPGRLYRIESSPDLNPNNWGLFKNVPGGSTPIHEDVYPSDARRFWRIMLVP